MCVRVWGGIWAVKDKYRDTENKAMQYDCVLKDNKPGPHL